MSLKSTSLIFSSLPPVFHSVSPSMSLLSDRLVCSACHPQLQSWERELKWAKEGGGGWVRVIPRERAPSQITKSRLYHDSQLTVWIIDRPQATGRSLNSVTNLLLQVMCERGKKRKLYIWKFWKEKSVFTQDMWSVAGAGRWCWWGPCALHGFTSWQWHTQYHFLSGGFIGIVIIAEKYIIYYILSMSLFWRKKNVLPKGEEKDPAPP